MFRFGFGFHFRFWIIYASISTSTLNADALNWELCASEWSTTCKSCHTIITWIAPAVCMRLADYTKYPKLQGPGLTVYAKAHGSMLASWH